MVDQSSLESKFGKQASSSNEKFVMTELLRRCNKCREFKPLKEFNKHKGCKNGLLSICKSCESNRSSKYYVDHRDFVLERNKLYEKGYTKRRREHNFLYIDQRSKGLILGTGICLICDEIYLPYIQNHHVLPKNDMVVGLCANCHEKHRSANKEKHMISVLNDIESSKFLWDSNGNPKGLKPVPMWTADLPLKEAIEILKSYDLSGYETVGIEV